MSAVLTAKSIKLALIENNLDRQATLIDDSAAVPFTTEALNSLVEALAFADKALSHDIETLLYKSGQAVVPLLLNGLLAANVNIKSTCAMALIRMGRTVMTDLNRFYDAHCHNTDLTHTLAFIYLELGSGLPVQTQLVTA